MASPGQSANILRSDGIEALSDHPRQVRHPDDDWAGLRDAAERRKRQNRINVREHRRRKGEQVRAQRLEERRQLILQNHARYCQDEQPWLVSECRPVRYWDRIDIMRLLNPLPVDQRLRLLVRYNIVRATATNMRILSIPHLIMGEDCVLIRRTVELFPVPTSVPDSLKPTALQSSTPHERWIDILPSPSLRDNIIKLWGSFDVVDLLTDLAGGPDMANIERTGMLVWAEPWHPPGWEMTRGFFIKWKSLIEGCDDLLQSTNLWRSLRGEDALVAGL